ncbi:MAG: enoyl-CoA hydratase-related protein [Acidimicrobiia bacterium]|nr:enoyl-CoA hydratase-related protein [Acidimicrobiia bacterium]
MANQAPYDRYAHLEVRVDDGVALVRIEAPGSVGRLQAAVHAEVARIWRTLGDDPAVRSVLVTGQGDEFYRSADAGGLKAIPGIGKEDTFELLQRMLGEGRDIVYGIVELDKPVVSAINGAAAGGGLAVALLADISIAAEDAVLVDPHVALGVAAGDHAAMIWPLLCGMAKSKLYLLTSDELDGREAERIGLVSRAVPADDVLDVASSYARRLADGPQHAIRYSKRALNQWLRLGGLTAHDYSAALEGLNFFGSELRAAAEKFGERGPNPAVTPSERGGAG